MKISYQLVRSARRKTLGLQVKAGKVIVRAPQNLPQKTIDSFVEQKSAWLRSHVENQIQLQSQQQDKFIDGSSLLVLGELKTIRLSFSKNAHVASNEKELLVTLPNRYQMLETDKQALAVKKCLEGWLKSQAEEYFSKMLPIFRDQTNLIFNQYKIRRYKSRWGSCNNKKELSFNYLLMMTPPWVINYVIVHELCHLKHLNHSQAFWQLVEQHFPCFRQAKQWLKENNAALQWQ